LQGIAQPEEQRAAPNEQQQSRLMTMAPSAPLHGTLSSSTLAAWEGSMLAAQDDYMILQEVVHKACQLHASMSSVVHTCCRLASHTSANEEQGQDPDLLLGTNAPHCFTDNDVNLIDELSLLQARGDVTSLPEHKVQNQREPSALSEAEVALLMDTLLGQLESELALMANVCSINLATPAPEVHSFIFLMELQPFLDTRLVSSLRQIASSQPVDF